jgi:hypothetical protein
MMLLLQSRRVRGEREGGRREGGRNQGRKEGDGRSV